MLCAVVFSVRNNFLFYLGEAKSRGWVVGRVCLKIKKDNYILAPSVLSPNLSLVLGLACFENFQLLIKKKRVRVRLGLGTHDPQPTTHPPMPIRHSHCILVYIIPGFKML